MSTQTSETDTDMRPEYDFSEGVRGKYAATLREEGYTIREYRYSRWGGLPPHRCYKTVLGTFDPTRLLSIRAVVIGTTTTESYHRRGLAPEPVGWQSFGYTLRSSVRQRRLS